MANNEKYAVPVSPLAVAIATVLATSTSTAATIVVNTAQDAALGVLDSQCSLRSAIASANTGAAVDGCSSGTAGHDRIEFAPELIGSTITLSAGQLALIGSATLAGPAAEDPAGITIDAAGISRILHLTGHPPGDHSVEIDSLTLTGGTVTGNWTPGGAVLASGVNVELFRVRVTNSSTDGMASGGGGIYVENGNLDVVESIISGNHTAGLESPGGGVQVINGNLDLKYTQVAGNSTLGEQSVGGGIYVGSGVAIAKYSLVRDNSTYGDLAYGGGWSAQDTDLLILDSRVSDNATHGYAAAGGGIFVYGDSSLVLAASDVIANDALGTHTIGGGIAAVYVPHVEILDSSIVGNRARNAGGIFAGASDTLLINRSTVAFNQTTLPNGRAGGAWLLGNATQVVNSTISGNVVQGDDGSGGGLFIEGQAELLHLTVAFNQAGQTDGLLWSGASSVSVFNSLLIQSDAGETACSGIPAAHGGTMATDSSCGVSVHTPAEIAVAPLDNNGGGTLTHALQDGSVARNAAGSCEADHGLTVDQRGQPRPGMGPVASLACDVGAFEYQQDGIFSDRFSLP